MDHSEYLKRRNELLRIRTGSFEAFDKAVLSLATGSLGLSIVFLDKIGKPFDFWTVLLICLSWGAFFLVIFANLFSYFFARQNMDRKMGELDSNYQEEIDTGKPVEGVEKNFWQRRATNICNLLALVFFVFGVLSFTVYIIKIQHRNYSNMMQEKEKNMSEQENKAKSESKTQAPKVAKITDSKELHKAGQTEASQAISNRKIPKEAVKGQTETGQAISKPNALKETIKEGQTEAPQAVNKPSSDQKQNTTAKTDE